MDIYEIRRRNLRTILDSRFDGKVKKLADLMDRQPSSIGRYVPRSGKIKPMGGKIAREIEQAVGLDNNWMDHVHAENLEPAHEMMIGEPENVYAVLSREGALMAEIMAAIEPQYDLPHNERSQAIARDALLVYDLLKSEEGPFSQREILLTWKAVKGGPDENKKNNAQPVKKGGQRS